MFQFLHVEFKCFNIIFFINYILLINIKLTLKNSLPNDKTEFSNEANYVSVKKFDNSKLFSENSPKALK